MHADRVFQDKAIGLDDYVISQADLDAVEYTTIRTSVTYVLDHISNPLLRSLSRSEQVDVLSQMIRDYLNTD